MVKESKPRKSKNVPSDEQLQSEIRALLIDADFSKVSDATEVRQQLHEYEMACGDGIDGF